MRTALLIHIWSSPLNSDEHIKVPLRIPQPPSPLPPATSHNKWKDNTKKLANVSFFLQFCLKSRFFFITSDDYWQQRAKETSSLRSLQNTRRRRGCSQRKRTTRTRRPLPDCCKMLYLTFPPNTLLLILDSFQRPSALKQLHTFLSAGGFILFFEDFLEDDNGWVFFSLFAWAAVFW